MHAMQCYHLKRVEDCYIYGMMLTDSLSSVSNGSDYNYYKTG